MMRSCVGNLGLNAIITKRVWTDALFLGTSQAFPRAHAMKRQFYYICNINAARVAFDCSEGTQHQMLDTAFHPSSLSAFYQPSSRDHLFGLPGLLYATGRGRESQSANRIRASKACVSLLQPHCALAVHMDRFSLQIEEEISAGDILDDGLRKVTAFRLEHPQGATDIALLNMTSTAR